ncbi:unnamed protein product [Echinostoma caproni]|uniref:C2H2-type domain-containing protein n=1 Tax=Echinostoma caproni TaxID=27848 RepID=A0A183AYU7_9TREM|nr:unnamed protein product [Echinostoma caproni]
MTRSKCDRPECAHYGAQLGSNCPHMRATGTAGTTEGRQMTLCPIPGCGRKLSQHVSLKMHLQFHWRTAAKLLKIPAICTETVRLPESS